MNDFLYDSALAEHLTMAAFTCMFYIPIDYKNEPNVKVATRNINIKIHQLFSKQWILDVRVTIAHPKTSVDLTRTCS